MLGTAELETIIHDNKLPAVILILHWKARGCHVHPCSAMVASPADAEHP